jgi:AcrR family transcriptional regulator
MPDELEAGLSEGLDSQDGFVAPRYRSGQRSADALLEAGRGLLATISYEGLTVSDLCKQAHLTTGAFYRRFESKDAFFLALQRLALDDAARTSRALQASLDKPTWTELEGAVHTVVDMTREWHLRHRGVIRASLQRRDHTLDSWHAFREFARTFVAAIAPRLARLPELRGRTDAQQRLTVGFQIVIGTMINAALNDPGPLSLEDAALTDALAQTLELYALASRR